MSQPPFQRTMFVQVPSGGYYDPQRPAPDWSDGFIVDHQAIASHSCAPQGCVTSTHGSAYVQTHRGAPLAQLDVHIEQTPAQTTLRGGYTGFCGPAESVAYNAANQELQRVGMVLNQDHQAFFANRPHIPMPAPPSVIQLAPPQRGPQAPNQGVAPAARPAPVAAIVVSQRPFAPAAIPAIVPPGPAAIPATVLSARVAGHRRPIEQTSAGQQPSRQVRHRGGNSPA